MHRNKIAWKIDSTIAQVSLKVKHYIYAFPLFMVDSNHSIDLGEKGLSTSAQLDPNLWF